MNGSKLSQTLEVPNVVGDIPGALKELSVIASFSQASKDPARENLTAMKS